MLVPSWPAMAFVVVQITASAAVSIRKRTSVDRRIGSRVS
jgi:hypothetical protein